jgi:hypothetical protein
MFLARNSAGAGSYFRLPPGQVLELGLEVAV